jgi:DnaJ-domain-containing protein 1
VAGCGEPGEFRAPLSAPDFDGPGRWQWLCLDHVRAHNQSYNFFKGMSSDEIEAAQSPIAGWERPSRTTLHAGGGDPPPAWSDFHDPLDAIGGRFRQRRQAAERTASSPLSRFTSVETRALGVLGLGEDAQLGAVRRRYSELVRKYHPDRNGGDRRHEVRLRAVIEAWQTLKVARAFDT